MKNKLNVNRVGVNIMSTDIKNKLYTTPSIKEAKRRGKSQVEIIDFENIPDDMIGSGIGRFYLIRTYGCQMNSHDSETMAGILEALGYLPTDKEREADIILFNTCAIRENAEDKVFGEIGRLKHLKLEKPDLILGVAGCMSQEEKVVNKLLKSYQHVDLIFGTHNIHRLPFILKDSMFNKEKIIEVWSKEGDIIEHMPKARNDGLKAWVNIMYGCDKFCTYCIVPYTRGKERSRKPEDVIAEVQELARLGYKEVTLLGQNVNSYGKDLELEYGFGNLLDDMRKISVPRIRFITSHPKDFDDYSIEVLAKGDNLVEHIHLPVQSGNTEILKRMARKYTREEYLELVNKIKKAIPNVVLTTDIIVGFPGETTEQFNDTLTLVEEIGFDSAYTFIYSAREGTPASSMVDENSEEEKKARLQQLMDLQNKISREKNEALLGRTFEILVEGDSKNNPEILSGRTRTNKLINFRGDKSLIGSFVKVRVTVPKTWSLTGEVVDSL